MLVRSDAIVSTAVRKRRANARAHNRHFRDPSCRSVNRTGSCRRLLDNLGMITSFSGHRVLVGGRIGTLTSRIGSSTVIPRSLLSRIATLISFPVTLQTDFRTHFLRMPRRTLVSAVRTSRGCFYLASGANGLRPCFVFVAGVRSGSPGRVVRNGRGIIHPHLTSTRFFFLRSRGRPLFTLARDLGAHMFRSGLNAV